MLEFFCLFAKIVFWGGRFFCNPSFLYRLGFLLYTSCMLRRFSVLLHLLIDCSKKLILVIINYCIYLFYMIKIKYIKLTILKNSILIKLKSN